MNSFHAIPRVIVEADGNPLSEEDASALGEVRVQQRLSLPSLCELAFFNPPGPLNATTVLTPGAVLKVSVEGFDTPPLFMGEVTAVEYVYGPSGDREFRIRAYDVLHRLRKHQSVRVHVLASLNSLAEDFLAGLGVTVASSAPSPSWQTLIQRGLSDLDFLADLAERCGLYFTLQDSEFHILTLEGQGDIIRLTLGRSLLEARIEANGEAAVETVSVTGWNPLEAQEYTGRATVARSGRRVSAHIPATAVGASKELQMVGATVEDNRHAEQLAQAELDRRVAREVVFWGVAEGDPRLRPGSTVDVVGVAEPVAGRYVLTSATHTIDGRRGFLSELSTMPPPPREPETGLHATFGLVTRVDDPEGLGRIRTSLPSYGNVETDWLQVLSIGGGSGKGLLMLPDVEDTVLVLCPTADPAQGVVIGSLFGMNGFPDSGVEGGAVRRYALWTAGGQRVQIEDTKSGIRLENSDGSYFELSTDVVRLYAARDLVIEAPGQPIVIRGQTIDFEGQ
jgi:phage protein D/phage baseplate assembly protein gpV